VRRTAIGRLAAAGALAAAVAVPAGGCAGQPVSPLPIETPAAAPASSAPGTTPSPSLSPSAGRTVRPKRTTTPKPTEDASCYGPVKVTVQVEDTELAFLDSMCIHVGGVLELRNIGPGMVDVTPERLVSQTYEGGVVDIRFVRPGTVTVTIRKNGHTYDITVVVIS
jgi:hypothetical protein